MQGNNGIRESAMGNWNIPDDYDGPPVPHRIRCRSGWEGCTGQHATAAEVKSCFQARADGAWPCSWLLEGRYDDGSRHTYACGAPTRYTDERGSYECDRGHDHVPADVRYEQGWEYAEDADEAKRLVRAGVRPVQLDGDAWVWT
jgi:hypothetical protein